MGEPTVLARIARFRLFTALVAFVRLAIRDLDFLQPDLAYARLLWEEWDRMLGARTARRAPTPQRPHPPGARARSGRVQHVAPGAAPQREARGEPRDVLRHGGGGALLPV